MQKAYLNPTPDQTFEIVGDGPYNFTRVLAHTRELEAAGNVEDACNERYQAFQRLAGLLPEDEEINLEWSHRNSQSALELIRASAIDHFLINDFEMSAALLEMLLELDPEDHLEGSELLAFDYLAMDEQELFDEVINDVSDKCASRGILRSGRHSVVKGRFPKENCCISRRGLRLSSGNLRPPSTLPTMLTCGISRANVPPCRRRRANFGCRPRTCGYCGPGLSLRCRLRSRPQVCPLFFAGFGRAGLLPAAIRIGYATFEMSFGGAFVALGVLFLV